MVRTKDGLDVQSRAILKCSAFLWEAFSFFCRLDAGGMLNFSWQAVTGIIARVASLEDIYLVPAGTIYLPLYNMDCTSPEL